MIAIFGTPEPSRFKFDHGIELRICKVMLGIESPFRVCT
jgi:hypothetical protein